MTQNQIVSDNSEHSLALETAWQHYAQLESNASAALKQFMNLRGWLTVMTVFATLLAIVISLPDSDLITPTVTEVLRAMLILIPITGSLILAFINKLQQGQYWLVLSTGAEEIRREIYLYRTLLQAEEKRHQWLNDRVATIQRQVFESIGGNVVLKPYTKEIPPNYLPADQNSDPGFSDLLADDYRRYRLEAQLNWYSQEISRLYATRTSLRVGMFALAGLSAFLPALATNFSIWITLTISMASALSIWQEVNRLDSSINNYNQIIVELSIIRDQWQSLSQEERNGNEFFKLVIATEKVLWSLHNQHINQSRIATAELYSQTGDLLAQVLSQPAPTLIDEAMLSKKQVALAILPEKTTEIQFIKKEKPAEPKVIKKGLPHAFVVMPFGRKKGPDGRWIDFNSIYQDLIKPALEEAGFESFRADEEEASGDIITDMFQELLLADLVLADLSIDNANVFYELGIRHALRKRGIVHIQCGRAYMPYDIFNVRVLPYHCDENGRPDLEYLEKDRQAIIKMAKATWESDQNRIHSPIFSILTGLCEPDRKTLRTPLATGYWEEFEVWQERITIAQRQKRIGDVLLLTEEVKNPLIKCEAIAEAGRALTYLGNSALALKEYRQGLKIDRNNPEFRREEAFHLSQLKQFDEAIVKLECLLQDEPTDIQAICYLANIYTQTWRDQWENITDQRERVIAAYEAGYLLKKAIETYLKAYRLDQNHYLAGSNALMLLSVLDHLAEQNSPDSESDLEEKTLRQHLPMLQGAVQFNLESAATRDTTDFQSFMELGDLAVCTEQDPKQVTRAYKKALTLLWNNKFVLKSSLDQLALLDALSFRPEYVQAGISVLQAELDRLEQQEQVMAVHLDSEPPQVFLFSGHMIDSPARPQPRFPAAMESEASQKIEQALDKLKPSTNCLAITPGIACGGDILFIEACLRRNMRIEVLLPFEVPKFIQESVSFVPGDWVERFYRIQNHPNVTISLQPDRLGDVPEGDNAYERNNRWALYSTLMYGIQRVRLIVLWDGKGGDAPGGTGDMVQQVRQLGGIVEHIDTTKFDYWQTPTGSSSASEQKSLVTA